MCTIALPATAAFKMSLSFAILTNQNDYNIKELLNVSIFFFFSFLLPEQKKTWLTSPADDSEQVRSWL